MKKYWYVFCFVFILVISFSFDSSVYQFNLPLTSGVSLMRIGVDPHPLVEEGKEIAALVWDAIENSNILPKNAKVIEADLQNPHLPFGDDSVDAAIASVVVHEMHQPVRMFKEMFRILKPAARFYIYDWVRVPLENYLQFMDRDP